MDTILILERLDRLEKLLIGSKEVLTFDEASDYTGISRSYLYKLTASKKIPHSKPNGKMVFFDKKKLVDWLLQHKREPELKIKGSTQAGNLAKKNI
ncbi:helix-turn-helix domain-containing protein [Mariniflexile jejuense]|uniref:Helix-turn-helix domain-containing protein n=1 Tax=Mariniflexile jejuense TaxID=1173582 RepID=A0ABW3JLV1_9FLAO